MAAKSTIYAQVLEANVGAIDIVDYNQTAPDGTPWVILEHWNEGRLGNKQWGRIILRESDSFLSGRLQNGGRCRKIL